LDALEAEAADAGEGFDGQSLGEARNAFHHGVAATDEDEEKLIHDLLLADDDLGKFTANMLCECG